MSDVCSLETLIKTRFYTRAFLFNPCGYYIFARRYTCIPQEQITLYKEQIEDKIALTSEIYT